jgi:hypothetical protein
MIFVDRSVPRRVAEALNTVRGDVDRLEPRYRHDTPDHVWLADAGRSDWLVVTRDRHVRTRPLERQAIEENGVGCFILAYRRTLDPWGILKLLANTLDEMERRFATTERPLIFTVSGGGRFRQYR